jgi:hypothetical protein
MAPCDRMDRRHTRGVAEEDLDADGRRRRDDKVISSGPVGWSR